MLSKTVIFGEFEKYGKDVHIANMLNKCEMKNKPTTYLIA